jgi:hypothetical protein
VRTLSILIAIPIALSVTVALSLWAVGTYRDLTYDWSQERFQGEIVCRAIMAGSDKPQAYWTPGRGWVKISVYEVSEQSAQERIIEIIAAMKARRELNRPVRLRFYERENWIQTPQDAQGIWGGHRGAWPWLLCRQPRPSVVAEGATRCLTINTARRSSGSYYAGVSNALLTTSISASPGGSGRAARPGRPATQAPLP